MSYATIALGWTLIHFCWQATAIALLYRLADAALSKAHSHVRYGAALVALLSMLAAAGVYPRLGVDPDRGRARCPDRVAQHSGCGQPSGVPPP